MRLSRRLMRPRRASARWQCSPSERRSQWRAGGWPRPTAPRSRHVLLVCNGTARCPDAKGDALLQVAAARGRPRAQRRLDPGVAGHYKEAVTVQPGHGLTNGLHIRGMNRNGVVLRRQRRPAAPRIHVHGRQQHLGREHDRPALPTGSANAFYWTGVDGYWGNYLTAYDNGDYGVYAYDSTSLGQDPVDLRLRLRLVERRQRHLHRRLPRLQRGHHELAGARTTRSATRAPTPAASSTSSTASGTTTRSGHRAQHADQRARPAAGRRLHRQQLRPRQQRRTNTPGSGITAHRAGRHGIEHRRRLGQHHPQQPDREPEARRGPPALALHPADQQPGRLQHASSTSGTPAARRRRHRLRRHRRPELRRRQRRHHRRQEAPGHDRPAEPGRTCRTAATTNPRPQAAARGIYEPGRPDRRAS